MRPAIGAAGNGAQCAAGTAGVVVDAAVDVVIDDVVIDDVVIDDVVIDDGGFEELEHAPIASPSAAIETTGRARVRLMVRTFVARRPVRQGRNSRRTRRKVTSPS